MRSRNCIWPILLLIFLSSCATVPKTKIYVGDTMSLPSSLTILPFIDRTTDNKIDENKLLSLQEKLVKKLQATGRFDKIIPAPSQEELITDAVVECSITQFDLGARRMVVATEVTDAKSRLLLVRMVTHSELVSIVWPIDYIGALDRSANVIINNLAKALSK